MDVLQLMAAGLRNKAIAGRLGLTFETVKQHVRDILQRLAVDNRTAAAVWYVRYIEQPRGWRVVWWLEPTDLAQEDFANLACRDFHERPDADTFARQVGGAVTRL